MSENESEQLEGFAAAPRFHVRLQMLKDGIYTWSVLAAEGSTLEDLRAVKNHAAVIARELEAEFPHGPVPEPPASPPRRRYQ